MNESILYQKAVPLLSLDLLNRFDPKGFHNSRLTQVSDQDSKYNHVTSSLPKPLAPHAMPAENLFSEV